MVAGLFGGAGVLLLPALLASDTDWLATRHGFAVTAYLGVVTTTVGYLSYGRGLRTTPVAAATTLTLAGPAVAALLGITVLGERLNAAGYAGLVLLGSSLLLLVLPARMRERPS